MTRNRAWTYFLFGLTALEIVFSVGLHLWSYFGPVPLDQGFGAGMAIVAFTWMYCFNVHMKAVYELNGWAWPDAWRNRWTREYLSTPIQIWTKREYIDAGMLYAPSLLRRFSVPLLLLSFCYAVAALCAANGTSGNDFFTQNSFTLLLTTFSLYCFSIAYSKFRELNYYAGH